MRRTTERDYNHTKVAWSSNIRKLARWSEKRLNNAKHTSGAQGSREITRSVVRNKELDIAAHEYYDHTSAMPEVQPENREISRRKWSKSRFECSILTPLLHAFLHRIRLLLHAEKCFIMDGGENRVSHRNRLTQGASGCNNIANHCLDLTIANIRYPKVQ